MSSSYSTLQPAALWKNFADLNAVPRASKKEERVIAFIKAFGESLQLPVTVDACGNVIIRKPGCHGMEKSNPVALQSHLDMVHQKNADTNFDFDKQGIDMYVDGDWVKARGTTLGADNGIGVASIMTLLASNDIPHPPLEALFTIDEETGMTGALGLKGGLLDAKVMLNLDTEDDIELTIGCAGGVDVTAQASYTPEACAPSMKGFLLRVKGLTGGHSGMDIHLGRGNANKLMNRVLSKVLDSVPAAVASIDGGSLRNAIPRESAAWIAVADGKEKELRTLVSDLEKILKEEYSLTDPSLALTVETAAAPPQVIPAAFLRPLIRAVYACPNGIHRMSPAIEGLVQTSNNLARILVKDGNCSIQCLTRSAVDSEKMDLADAIRACFELAGASVGFAGSYPGWTPRPDSGIVQLMSGLYEERYGSKPHVNACHAGLECGILGANYPETEMISFGPNIRGAHSPDEKVQISSVQKYWAFLLETLRSLH